MGRVLTSGGTGAAVYVFSYDHCPPHVHARHRGDEWIARVAFSYINNAVTLMSVAPLRLAPQPRVLNRLLDDIEAALPACRRSWWLTRRTTCLANQWVILPASAARQIADASYDPASQRLRVIFADGTIADLGMPS
jgi:hypothetical protein